MKEAKGNENNFKMKQNSKQKLLLVSQHRKPLQSIASNEDPNNVCQREAMKPVRTLLEGSGHVTLKLKHSLGNYLPQKRMSDVVEYDDFE